MISPEQSGDIKKNYCGHKIELFLDNLGNQELDNLRDHKQYSYRGTELIVDQLNDEKIKFNYSNSNAYQNSHEIEDELEL